MDKEIVTEWLKRLLSGDRRAVAKLISLVEDGIEYEFIMRQIIPRSGESPVIGITGPPGAGKSSLVDALIHLYRQENRTMGVVAVDPTSPYSGGAILGDRVRMQNHGIDRNVFIRSMGTRGHLGGVARFTSAVLRILEAGGFNELVLETVGVGQSEIEIMNMADTVIVVLNPGAGDGIQVIKAGIMEIADIFVVNKADQEGAESLESEIKMMLGMQDKIRAWNASVVLTSVVEGTGLNELKQRIEEHKNFLAESGLKNKNRKARIEREAWDYIENRVRSAFDAAVEKFSDEYEAVKDNDPLEFANKVFLEILRQGLS